MAGIKRRYKLAREILKHMGIFLDDSPTFQTFELVFTFATDLLLPTTVRMLIVSSFSASCKIDFSTVEGPTSTDGDASYISNRRYKTNKIVLYDKIAKAESLNRIQRHWRNKRIYRLEFCLSRDNLKKNDILATCSLNEITDEMLKDYFVYRIDKAIDYYCNKICPQSTTLLADLISKYREKHPRTYVGPLMTKTSDLYKHSSKPFVLDIESFCHYKENEEILSDKGKDKSRYKNNARSRYNLIHSTCIENGDLSDMYGWETERLFSFMKACVIGNMGIYADHTRDNVHCFQVAYGKYKTKYTYLEEFIHSNLIRDYSKVAEERIRNKWVDPNFSLNHIKDGVKLPDKEFLF